MKTTRRLLAPVEAAALLCFPTRQLIALARAGSVPCVQLPGDEIRFDADDLRDWIEARKRPSPEDRDDA